mmetsp:Transcript_21039/g.38029  ORF Transcript_21039/g.38029 Transcript_21039/m.38029 type:complete len:580 (+) Transcript_21039:221-1960(+)
MSAPHQLPKRVFPVPYQVDFTAESKGRHLDSTKRKLTWKFGFAHPPAVFPHLYDANEMYIGDITNNTNTSMVVPYPTNPKKGVECRGREHELILTWSILTGKAHIYVDSKEIFRQEPAADSIFSSFTSSFHRGFDLPNPKFNGRHRIDIRCYARTPMGAKNMVVDDQGGRFRQYDLTVDGLSYFSMPAVFELGTENMWNKVRRWGLMRLESSSQEEERGGTSGERRHSASGNFERKGRMVDEYHFDKAKGRSDYNKYGQSISKNEKKAMHPRTESDEERMMRIAMEASLKDWEKDAGYGNKNSGSSQKPAIRSHSSSSEENNGASGNRQNRSRRTKKPNGATNLGAIGEDNLIDFGADEGERTVSQITFSRETTSDVSVMDDDATTASFMMNTGWNSNVAQQQPAMPAQQPPVGQIYSNYQQPPQYHDPTFRQPQYQDPRAQYAQQQWNSVGTLSSTPATPTNRPGIPSDASFAFAPPPTLDDYRDAFGGSVMGGSTMMVNPMLSPASSALGMNSPMAQQQQAQQYGMQQAPSQLSPQWQSQSFGAPVGGGAGGGWGAPAAQMGERNKFDPMRADPFAS